MRLLYVTESVPTWNPEHGDGSSIISWEVIRILHAEVSVTLLTFGGPVDVTDELRQRCEAVHVLPTRRHLLAVILSVLSLYDVGTLERSTRAAAATAAQLFSQSKVSLVHGPHAMFLARHLQGPVALETVDPWSVRVGMESVMTRGWRTWYRAVKSRLLLVAERRIPPRARLLSVAPQDAAQWAERLDREVCSIPNGVVAHTRTVQQRERPVVCFIGSLNYGLNISSVEILIQRFAPMVWREVPEAKLAHPLLTVEGDIKRFVAEVVNRLTVDRRAAGLEGNGAPLRRWGDVAQDHLRERNYALHETSGKLQQEGRYA
ncbi:hypothetical protein E2F48_15035 [Arthrobacter crusticola]|uniref:Glycosyltransferase subfamily 4-like N-terminal domain-containing protein n=1 Tax=Arthrobacter crusticola TaxID=2547960 RepID=A0A4R5TTJ3_9MICC|nr:hypothetical protein [Arthrobacter crusticola]TDK24090.1 hypothetical protein E2F48_15035 [Arthrobacter crusticola]